MFIRADAIVVRVRDIAGFDIYITRTCAAAHMPINSHK
jgi:hypothetical protein